MRRIIVGARVSMDGVMQEPMGPSEGFKLGGWSRPYQDQDCGEEFDRLLLSEKYDLLLGRKTYEIFARYWPYQVCEDGPNLLTQGSTELVHALLANDLVDAMTIFTVPVVLGGGKTLFADGSAPRAYKLTRSRVSGTGVMIGHYERDGEIKIGDTALNSPSKAG